jgi:Aspartyl protease
VCVPRLVALVIAAGCATSTNAPTPQRAATGAWEEVPARWNGTYVFVDVEVNGSLQSMLLDTGSDVTILDPELVSRLGIPTVELEFPLETSSGWSEPERRKCATVKLRVGRLAQEADALVLPLDGVSRALGEPIVGLLGFHIWAGVSVRIDYPRHVVHVRDDALPPADGKSVIATEPGRARMRLDLPGGTSTTVVIDSASEACLVLPDRLERDLRFKAPPRVTDYLRTLAGTVERRTARLAVPVSIGRYVVKDPLVGFLEGDTGVMGTRVLRNFSVTFDSVRSRVAFDREGPDEIQVPPLRGIGAGFLKDHEVWTVYFVLEGGGAERAGLREGDQVLAVDGSAENLRRERFGELMRTAETVRLDVQRAGARLLLHVPVEVLVE